MLVSVLIFTLIGSFISSNISNDVMGSFSKIMMLLVGIKFIVKPITRTCENNQSGDNKKYVLKSIICGALMDLCAALLALVEEC